MPSEQANIRWIPSRPLTLLFGVFFLVGLWQILLVPFFQGPDEQVHYATVQHWAEPKERLWPIMHRVDTPESNDVRTYRFSEEIRETAHRLQFDEIKWQATNSQTFKDGGDKGFEEDSITNNRWKRFIDTYPANASGTWSLYYWFGGQIESQLSNFSILDRIFSLRLFSVCIGALIVLVALMIARRLGWSPTLATLFASLIAFQPMFVATSAVINIDILLVFAFSLFFYGATCWLTGKPSWPSGIVLCTSVTIGIFTKGPGIVLLGLLFVLALFSFYQRYRTHCRDFFPYCLLAGFVIASLFFIFTPAHILANFLHLGTTSVFASPFESIGVYFEKTLTIGATTWTAMTYWGSFGWLDTNLPGSVLQVILAIEIASLFGLAWLFFDKTPPRFLPNKSVLLFALISIIFLQFAIRFFDWRIFDTTGKILSGTPGRYFLPNIIPHFLLVISGLGYFMRTREAFQRLILILSVSLFILASYALWFVILPRYYL